jgi:hypothetical protein
MKDYDESDIKNIIELTDKEPRTCSITAWNDGGGFVLDQSLDITVRGDPAEARKCVLFLFPMTIKDGDMTFSINREFMARMDECRDVSIKGDYHANGFDIGTGMRVEFRSSHDPKDVGHLMNAFRANGAVRYFDRGIRARSERPKELSRKGELMVGLSFGADGRSYYYKTGGE